MTSPGKDGASRVTAVQCAGAQKAFWESGNGSAENKRPGQWPWALSGGRRRQVAAVDGVSFEVAPGSIFGVLGPNGSGKSTLIRLIATLLLPDAGAITVMGRDVVRERMAVRRLINRVSVDAAFFKKLSSLENLRYAARLYGLDVREAERRACEILARLGLERRQLTSSMEDLSRGTQQKVAIARAFLSDPQVLLLDEPTTGLDPRSKLDVQQFVLDVRRERGLAVILTSHDMAEADKLCDEVAFIDHGRFVAAGTPEQLRSRLPGAEGSLEDVFLHVTGKAWTEEAAGAEVGRQ